MSTGSTAFERSLVSSWLAIASVMWVLSADPLTAAAEVRSSSEKASDPARAGANDDSAAAQDNTAAQDEAAAPDDSGSNPWQMGPARIDLGHDIALALPAEHAFLPKQLAAKLLESNGGLYNANLLGLVAASSLSDDWFVVLRFDAEGYVKDDEEVDAEELLEAMREGNEAANEERQQRGFKPLTLEGWSDAPHYDKSRHQLIWSLIVSDPDGKSVNYNTRVLGRRGFVSLNLVTDPNRLAEFKPQASALLVGTGFNPGARYEDFDEKSDKVAEYGLAGLVMAGAGLGAAKLVKIGLLAKAWNLIFFALVAGKKFIVVGLLGLAALLRKLSNDRKKNQPAA